MNYYEILGVESTATAEEIKEAYRNKAKELHPDTLPRDVNETVRKLAEEKFKELNHAYEILSDADKKREYDAELSNLQRANLMKKIRDFFNNGQLSDAVECAKRLYVLLPEDAECCDIYAEVLQELAIALEETKTAENLTQAKEYLTTALEVVKSAEIKNQITANLELLKSRTGTTGGRERREGETQTIKITTERAFQMLRGGEAGIRAWNQFRAMENYIPSLEGVDLSGQILINANLSGANLKNSKFIKAVFREVNFSNSNLTECDFTGTEFTNANFNNADIESANLTSVFCYASSFANANLQNAILNQSKWFVVFGGTNKSGCFESGYLITDFQGANLSGASVIGASLRECNLEGATLTRTNFSNADLTGANLKNTTIVDTDFKGTDLSKADLTGANAYYFAFHDGNTKINETKGID
ncbi:MAG: pentapeptide repeat-containing protein [Woronichinia naegeliana WA131]|jgi:uncharacterized protein YjbI with pentapeptide repeats|uniref:Pentapeptide repeat-containing protein n=1 Tax=Woronichinia naegeliana WA131 TaxID=2824559 RepID=A0A977L1T9_9CYAN|nr:MAG: pentapeptide repeat-containing protein [Woronichinia naegeliana WA131]